MIALLAGIAGILLCGLVPLLPVQQSTATINWPQAPAADGNVESVTAPLVSGAPQSLDVSVPCTAIATLPPAGGVALSTIPAAGIDASLNGLFIRANAETVTVAIRDTVAAFAPRADVESGKCSVIHVWADAGGVGADFVGIPGATNTLAVDKKPQVAGVFTDLKSPPVPGLSARVDIDTRFITSPTALKLAAMVLGVLCVLISIVALARIDAASTGRRPAHPWRRLLRVSPSTWLADLGVLGTLGLWHLLGATSSDDGYNTTIARISDDAGYHANYYRYFGATEAPFDWYQSLLAQLTHVSTQGVWLRLPATLAGLGTWLLLSRFVLPRLGRRLADSPITVWTGAAVFLAAWLPFNNGLRPEPLIAFGTLAVWALVENSIATRRLWPTAVAIVVAVFSVTTAPQGLIALAPLLVGTRALAAVLRSRRAAAGLLAQLAPLAAALTLVFVLVFRDQTLAAVAESARIKYKVGPTIAWYQDFLRYYFLTVEESVDGSLTRRFAVLLMLLCLFGVLAVLLRRGKVPGAANGPLWRLVG
ncbi:MAG TPA: arabinosyltransferase domain-containing protein, partial [Mycobacterium sp.]|nr:arabinosyltransferase domain-containing protein [Mycobacterium sp.]